MQIPLFLLSLLAVHTQAIDKTVNPELVSKLKTATTAIDRQALLPHDSDWTFDFTTQKKYTYAPGGVVNANAASFPALAPFDMTLAMLALGPCAMLPPHYHPRATNLVIAVEGETNTWMLEENGARVVKSNLTPGKMTIFPAGSLHTMQNLKCTNATLISTLNSADTGTQNMVNALFQMPLDLVEAGFGKYGPKLDFDDLIKNVPGVGTGSIMGSKECRKRCGLD